jgi:hypothetical protein
MLNPLLAEILMREREREMKRCLHLAALIKEANAAAADRQRSRSAPSQGALDYVRRARRIAELRLRLISGKNITPHLSE